MLSHLKYSILLSSSLTITLICGQFAVAESKKTTENNQEPKIVFNLPTPPNRGIPLGRHKGGGSRNLCPNGQNLTALVPANNKIVWGKTIAEHPEFLFYIPQGSSIEFVLQDESDNYIYQTTRQINPEDLGILKIAIPDTAIPLANNKIYQWTLSLACNENNPHAFVYVNGSIEKVTLERETLEQLETKKEIETAIIYAEAGIWYDAIALLAELRHQNPDDIDINTIWTELLKQVDLTAIASQPIVN